MGNVEENEKIWKRSMKIMKNLEKKEKNEKCKVKNY